MYTCALNGEDLNKNKILAVYNKIKSVLYYLGRDFIAESKPINRVSVK